MLLQRDTEEEGCWKSSVQPRAARCRIAQSMRHRRESKSSAINFNLSTTSKSTDSGGSSLTSNTHKETLPWWQAPPWARAREEEEDGNGCILQRMLCTASSHDSLTSLTPGWQFRPWHMEPVRFTKGSVLSHQLSAELLAEIPLSAQVSSLEDMMEELDQLPVVATCTMMQALVLPPMNYLMYSLSQLFTVWPRHQIHNVYDGFRHSRATVTPVFQE